MRLNDRMLAMVEEAGIPPAEADAALSTVMAYVIGTSVSEAAWLAMVERSGQDERAWQDRLRPAVERATRSYPRLRTQIRGRAGQEPARLREEAFDYGLNLICDGLQTRLAGRPAVP
jgi:hypothetical protein